MQSRRHKFSIAPQSWSLTANKELCGWSCTGANVGGGTANKEYLPPTEGNDGTGAAGGTSLRANGNGGVGGASAVNDTEGNGTGAAGGTSGNFDQTMEPNGRDRERVSNTSDISRGVEPNGGDAERVSDTAEKKRWC